MAATITATGEPGIVYEILTAGTPFSIDPRTGVLSANTAIGMEFIGQRYAFTIRAWAAARSPIFVDREFSIDSALRLPGAWNANRPNAVVASIRTPMTIKLGGTGIWTYLNGSNFDCPNTTFIEAGWSFTAAGEMSFKPVTWQSQHPLEQLHATHHERCRLDIRIIGTPNEVSAEKIFPDYAPCYAPC